MKIMHIGQMIGGLDVYIRNIITYTDGEEFEYVILRGRGDDNPPVLKNGTNITEYQINLYRQLNPLKDIRAVIEAVRLVKKEKPDIIHCHSAKGGVVGRIAGWLTNTKTLYTPHAFSFLSTKSAVKRWLYLQVERLVRFDSWLLACSESERRLGIDEVYYKKEKALVWCNSVPDALTIVGNE